MVDGISLLWIKNIVARDWTIILWVTDSVVVAVFEDGLHALDVADVLRPVTGKDHQIRSLSGRYGNERRDSVKSPVQRRLRAPMSSAAGALRSSTVQQCVIPDT